MNLRKNVWIKRGDFVVVKPIEEGDKVKAEILTILYKEQIKYIKAENQWPEGFESKIDDQEEGVEEEAWRGLPVCGGVTGGGATDDVIRT